MYLQFFNNQYELIPTHEEREEKRANLAEQKVELAQKEAEQERQRAEQEKALAKKTRN